MSPRLSVILPYTPATAGTAARFARSLAGKAEVLLAGHGEVDVPAAPHVHLLSGQENKGAALRAALERVTSPITVIQEPDGAYPLEHHETLCRLIQDDAADVVSGGRQAPGLATARVLGRFSNLVTGLGLKDPLSGQRAFRTEALRSITLTGNDDSVDAEIIVKLAARLYRFAEVPLPLTSAPRLPLSTQLSHLRTLLRYATVQNDADNQHEGYNTLERMNGAHNYNRWIARRFRPYLGRRVLEVGAGIGTITREIEEGRELLIALEVERFYVERLQNLFRGKPHVRPYLTDVAIADWESLRAERIDTIVLSNVLEHIPEDLAAVERFRGILQPGGRVVILVPALPQLFGALDEAVGHHRRYTPEGLRKVLEDGGFEVEALEWMNLVGIPGWFVNGRLLGRRTMPALQLRLYDTVAPLLAQAESRVNLPVGMSLFAVARLPGGAA